MNKVFMAALDYVSVICRRFFITFSHGEKYILSSPRTSSIVSCFVFRPLNYVSHKHLFAVK